MIKFISKNVDDTMKLGYSLGSLLAPKDVVLLEGDLSCGKTTLTKGIGKALDVKRVINSPTFTIVKVYTGKFKLYHMDLYRLDGLGNDFDLYEYFEAEDGVCVVEWPHQVEELLPSEHLKVSIKRLSEDEREFTIEAFGKRYEELEGELKCIL